MANCETCKGKETHAPERVPYIVHESAMARAERTVKRLWITILTLIFLLVGSNCVWIWWNSQWETVYQEVTQKADNGTNNFVGGDVIGETDYQNP
jgi:flagellar basal body-associated protein FliL